MPGEVYHLGHSCGRSRSASVLLRLDHGLSFWERKAYGAEMIYGIMIDVVSVM
jgi:hypothetical protein